MEEMGSTEHGKTTSMEDSLNDSDAWSDTSDLGTSFKPRIPPEWWRDGPEMEDATFCQRCQELDFESKFEPIEIPEDRSSESTDVELHIDMKSLDSNCTLCTLLQTGTISRPNGINNFICERSDGYRESWMVSWSAMGHIDISRHTPPRVYAKGTWPRDPDTADLDNLRAKLNHCKTTHGEACAKGPKTPIKGLRLFNCETRTLETATADTEYVTLSYVWGQRHLSPGAELPRTIRAAMTVTRQLGYTHIWLDQLCIEQGSGAHVASQIRQMQHIYHNAEATIVAGAGADADHGIPGVDGKRRPGRRRFRFGDLRVLELGPGVEELLERSVWNERGWTLQEMVLSRRLLVFTEAEAWFECPRVAPGRGRESRPAEGGRSDGEEERANAWHLSNRAYPFNLSRMVERFCDRRLSYQSDALNAFAGILAALECADPPIYHVCGSPVLPALCCDENLDPVPLGRTSAEGFLCGLMWSHNLAYPLRRRAGFPSWSWTGWIGYRPFDFYEYDRGHRPSGISVVVERTDGGSLTWPEFERLAYLKDEPASIAPFICLRNAWTLTVAVERHRPKAYLDRFGRLADSGTLGRLCTVLHTKSGEKLLAEALFFELVDDYALEPPEESVIQEQMDRLQEKEYIGVVLDGLKTRVRDWRGKTYIMLVEERGGHAERVGYIELEVNRLWDWSGDLLKNSQSAYREKLLLSDLKMQKKDIRLG